MSDESTNRSFAESDLLFRTACSLAEIEPTKRQASKWRRHTGTAYLKRNQAKKELASAEG